MRGLYEWLVRNGHMVQDALLNVEYQLRVNTNRVRVVMEGQMLMTNQRRATNLPRPLHIGCFIIADSGFVTAPGWVHSSSVRCSVRQNGSKGRRRGTPHARDEE